MNRTSYTKDGESLGVSGLESGQDLFGMGWGATSQRGGVGACGDKNEMAG